MCRTDLTKSVVLPELIELSRDEGCSVRLAAFETLVNLLDIFDTGKSSCGHTFASRFCSTDKEYRWVQDRFSHVTFHDEC